MKVLILGGYGIFGGRLAALLAGEARFMLLIAGRSREKAAAFCAALDARGPALPFAFGVALVTEGAARRHARVRRWRPFRLRCRDSPRARRAHRAL